MLENLTAVSEFILVRAEATSSSLTLRDTPVDSRGAMEFIRGRKNFSKFFTNTM